MKIAVSELIVRFIERLGIDHVFGMPGAHILPVYDSLRDSRVKTVLVKHEQGAAFMAGGHARATGRMAACITTAGPGATNLITGIASAYADRLPILIITAETSTHIFGKGGLQESSGEGGSIDQSLLFGPITRYHRLIERTDYLGNVLNQAARILRAANPGPVLLSLPYNVQKERVDAGILDRIAVPLPPAHPPQDVPVDSLARLLGAADYPVIVAGYGCIRAGAQERVAQLSQLLDIPVATSLKAKGVIGDDSALALGCLGVTSDGRAYQYIANHVDLVLFLGAGLNERTSHVWDGKLTGGKTVVQVDHDPGQLEKVFKADLAIHGDIDAVLASLLDRLHSAGPAKKRLDRFRAHCARNGGSNAGWPGEPSRFGLIRHFFAALERHFPQGAMVFDDNIIFAQNFFRVTQGNRYFPNSGISSLGHAIPAAIGARFGGDAPTFAILGDGGFQMCCMEIMTAVNYAIPLNVVVLNNAGLGLIRKNQFQLYGQRYIDCDFVNPDFGHLARAFGIAHRRIEAEADVDALFADCDLSGAINLIEIMLDKDAFPDYLSGRESG